MRLVDITATTYGQTEPSPEFKPSTRRRLRGTSVRFVRPLPHSTPEKHRVGWLTARGRLCNVSLRENCRRAMNVPGRADVIFLSVGDVPRIIILLNRARDRF